VSRAQIAALRAADSPDAGDPVGELPPTLLLARDRFPDHISRLSADLLEQDARICAALDGVHWPDDQGGQAAHLLERLAGQPALYHRLLALTERLATLTGVALDNPQVDQLIADWAAALAADPALAALLTQAPALNATVAGVLHAAALATLSPAQRRVITALAPQPDQPATLAGPCP